MNKTKTLTISKPTFTEKKYVVTLVFVISLFMLWGIAITMGDVLNRHFQNILNVSKAQSGLVQFSIFGAYAVMGVPAGMFMKRYGYKSGVLLGLVLYALGAFMFVPAANAESFGFFRLALFVLAGGLATLEAVAHPFVASLGDERTSDQRLNFAQAFNGLGAVIGPLLGAHFLLDAAQDTQGGLESVKTLYLVIGSVIAMLAIAFSMVKVPKLQDTHAIDPDAQIVPVDPSEVTEPKTLFQHKHFVWSVVAQFFNIAAQGGIWAFFINFGVEKVEGMTDQSTAMYFSFSMVMMMLGRFVGTFLIRFIAANRLLAIYAVANILMCVIVAQSWGWASFIALIMINFFLSIMYPTIFSLGLKDLGEHKQQASSFIVMGMAGGAVFPSLMGLVANYDVAYAYYLPILCYLVVFLFGVKLYKSR